MITGRVMIESVSEAARMLVPNFRKSTNRPNPNRPYTTEGMPGQVDDGDADQARQEGVIWRILGDINRRGDPQRHREDGRAQGQSRRCR